MKKKLALILISLDECFTKKGFSGGGHKVTKKLIEGLVNSGLFEIDIFCKVSAVNSLEGIHSIKVLGKKDFEAKVKGQISLKSYDYVLSSDILLPFANLLIHSNSSPYKSKNGKSKLVYFVSKFYNANKIKKQQKSFEGNYRAFFTVSESLKKDYVESFGLDEDRVFSVYPAVDDCALCEQKPLGEKFLIGSMAGGGLNKGGYLLLLALRMLPESSRLHARIIFPKIGKSGFFRWFVNFLGLKNRVEILPKQSDMNEFYKTIDCYVLPSLNEAFGLVVTEAASNCRPSLVSSTTGVRELIKDGENGFVFIREKNPVKNLADKLKEIESLYFRDHEKFVQISASAQEMSGKLEWKKFSETIIKNLIGEKID